MTTVVSDSGPLTHLWQVGQWRAFSTFTAMHIAEQVAQEVRLHVSLDESEQHIGYAISVRDVLQAEIVSCRAELPSGLVLQDADVATIALAQQITPDLVLTDDLALRQAVEAKAMTPMGSVGVIVRAFKSGVLDTQALERAIDGLFVHSTLYLSPQFKTYVLSLIAEMTAKPSK